MSQEKVDRYKQEKYNRKNVKKKSNIKKIVSYIVATLIGIAFVVYIGYSIAVATGLYTPPVVTTHVELSQSELESLRNTLIQKGDSNVRGDTSVSVDTTTSAEETTTEGTTTQSSTEEDVTVEETTAE